ncbi:MAG: hypothetical protein AAGD35_18585 [Actinomycetota bacterium]
MAAKRKNYPLRLDPAVHAAIERWANDELRSVNAQIEFLLRESLRRAGRLEGGAPPPRADGDREDGGRGDGDDTAGTTGR